MDLMRQRWTAEMALSWLTPATGAKMTPPVVAAFGSFAVSAAWAPLVALPVMVF